RPVVFHAVAYKHVAMLETHPLESVRNNVVGTRVLVELAAEFGVERFVFVSTDKAVNPKTVMGQSKALCEWVVESFGHRRDVATRYVAVRFGNVLNSSGSVIPIFRKQIERGGPVTVTHPEMTRYFMTIPEAVSLVVQAGAIGGRGQVFVLDMAEPAPGRSRLARRAARGAATARRRGGHARGRRHAAEGRARAEAPWRARACPPGRRR